MKELRITGTIFSLIMIIVWVDLVLKRSDATAYGFYSTAPLAALSGLFFLSSIASSLQELVDLKKAEMKAREPKEPEKKPTNTLRRSS